MLTYGLFGFTVERECAHRVAEQFPDMPAKEQGTRVDQCVMWIAKTIVKQNEGVMAKLLRDDVEGGAG